MRLSGHRMDIENRNNLQKKLPHSIKRGEVKYKCSSNKNFLILLIKYLLTFFCQYVNKVTV